MLYVSVLNDYAFAVIFKATLNGKGQFILPKAIRERFNLHQGDHVLLDLQGERVELRFLPKLTVDQIFNSLSATDQPTLEEQQITDLFGQHRLDRASSLNINR